MFTDIYHIGYLTESNAAAIAELRGKGIGFAAAAPNVNPRGHQVLYLDSATTQGIRIHLTQT